MLFLRRSFPTVAPNLLISSGVNILLHLILEILEGHDTCHGIKENKNVSQSTVAARERRREIQCSQENDCRRIML